MAGHVGNILCGLQSPFNLKADHPSLNQLRNNLISRKILWTKEIINIPKVLRNPIFQKLVRHPASLGALSTVGGSTPKCFAGKALPRIGHTECPVNERLQRHAWFFCVNFFDLFDRKLTGKDHTVAS